MTEAHVWISPWARIGPTDDELREAYERIAREAVKAAEPEIRAAIAKAMNVEVMS